VLFYNNSHDASLQKLDISNQSASEAVNHGEE